MRASEVGDAEARRFVANEYMARAARVARDALRRVATEALPKVSVANKVAVEDGAQGPGRGVRRPVPVVQARADGPGRVRPAADTRRLRAADVEQTLAVAKSARLRQVAAAAGHPGRRQGGRRRGAARHRGRAALQSPAAANQRQHYFANQPADTNRDAVEFLLWLKKADRLGIAFSDADVIDLANKEFYGAHDRRRLAHGRRRPARPPAGRRRRNSGRRWPTSSASGPPSGRCWG